MATIVSTRASTRTKVAAKPEAVRAAKKGVDNDPSTTQELLRELHLTRPDGTACFGGDSDRTERRVCRERLKTAIQQDGSDELAAILRRLERREAGSAPVRAGGKAPAASYHSEELWTSVLRTDWSAGAAQLAVDWSTADLHCDLTVGGDRLLSGVLPPRVLLDGRPLKAVGAWEEVCWDSDKYADYLELEIALEHGARLQRQFLLTRTDGLLFIADALLAAKHGDLAVETALPVTAATTVSAVGETREYRLTAGRRKRLVVPLGLSEWAGDARRGELFAEEGRLTLRQSARSANALYAPLCVVVDPKRAGREMTWRQLTIGENLQIQPADRAVGYRLQLGREQWMFYRSLTARANRTLLGVNLQTNFLCARFLRNGEIEQLMEIED